MFDPNEDAQIHSVEESLVATFQGRIPPARVKAVVAESRKAFDDAKIRTFVPVLVQHQASSELRHLV